MASTESGITRRRLLGGAGALGAAALLVLWTVRGWGTVRRVPGSVQEAHD